MRKEMVRGNQGKRRSKKTVRRRKSTIFACVKFEVKTISDYEVCFYMGFPAPRSVRYKPTFRSNKPNKVAHEMSYHCL